MRVVPGEKASSEMDSRFRVREEIEAIDDGFWVYAGGEEPPCSAGTSDTPFRSAPVPKSIHYGKLVWCYKTSSGKGGLDSDKVSHLPSDLRVKFG